MFENRSKDEFSFPCSVTRIHNFCDRFVLDQLKDGRQLFLASPTLWFVLKRIGNKRQTVDRASPIFEGFIVIVHVLEFEQVTNGPRDDDVLTVPVCLHFFSDAQDAGEVLRHTGFLSDDDDGHVVKARRRPYLNPPLAS